MKKKLIVNNTILLLTAFILFFLVAFISLFLFERNNQSQFMGYIIDEVALSYDQFEGTPVEFVDQYVNENGRRITILDVNASVLADTHDEVVGTDKSQRPEILDLGSVHTRQSATLDLGMIYIARLMSDGNYLRVAVELADQTAAYNRTVLIFIISSIGFLGLYYIGLTQVNKNLLSPWDQVKKGLIALSHGKYQVMSLNSPYEEINEILHEMNGINMETAKYLQTIEAYQIQLSDILNAMHQGVMLFDQDENLVYSNDDAKELFDISQDAIDHPNYQSIRDLSLKKAISKTNQFKKPSIFDIKLGSRIIECKIFYISTEKMKQKAATVLAMFKDVTQERSVEQMKRDFFSHASHELKSPLTAIRGYAELIEMGLIKGEEISQSATQIVKQTETMTALVEDMLMLSRLENLQEKQYTNNDMDSILRNVIKQLQPAITDKKIKIDLSSKPLMMLCDQLDIQKLFKNLIENAIKYSENDKEVVIQLKSSNNEIIFDIKDQGIGISSEHQQRVFERFYRVDKGRLDGGTGLGLAIVKHIVMKYEGNIQLESGLSKGTHIIIKLKK
ncbi:MAG: GHKL domain-containing protein [Acholeplasmataceae bacterium]|nr:GHKL domain-containing protein [Acholeplasmataceae bacterium]